MATTNFKAEMKERENSRDGGRDRDDDKMSKKSFNRRKACRFCADQDYILDYKDVKMMQSYITEHGKIVARRISGICTGHQRHLTSAVKRARNLALVGYISNGN